MGIHKSLAFHYNLTFTFFKKSLKKKRREKDIQRHFSSIAKWSNIFVTLSTFPLHQVSDENLMGLASNTLTSSHWGVFIEIDKNRHKWAQKD